MGKSDNSGDFGTENGAIAWKFGSGSGCFDGFAGCAGGRHGRRDDEDGEQDRTFEVMPAPSNAALHRYIRDLARVRMDLAAMQSGEKENGGQAMAQLELRVKAEQEATQNWVKRVCKAAGALSIVDSAFSPRK